MTAVAQEHVSVPSARATSRAAAQVVVIALVLYAALDTATWFIYRHPGVLRLARSNPIAIAFRNLHRVEVPLIQWEPACARYNEAVENYTLRPGPCRHIAQEFAVEVAANSLGLRDSEAALTRPEVIVLGSSFAMGWGVSVEETLARLTGRATGLRVLNAAVPGYSMRQSLALLSRLDRSQMRYLVIVYFLPQDTRNIRAALSQGEPATSYRLPREAYEEVVVQYLARRRGLVPGTYFYRLAAGMATIGRERWEIERTADEAAFTPSFYESAGRDVIEFLARAAPILGDSRIIFVASTPGCRRTTDRLAAAVDAAVAKGLKPFPNPVTSTRVEAELDSSHCFVLDNHLNAKAHALYARKISDIILADRRGGH
jgi:hypothetical protein